MIVPRVDFNSEIMQCHTCGKDVFYKVVRPEPALVFDDAHDFRASYDMFYTHPDGGNFLVVFLVLPGKLFPFGLLDRLYDFHPLRLIALVSRILIQGARHRKRIHCVSHLLVVGLARNGLTDKYNQTSHRYNDGVLDRVPFFLAAVTLLLHVPVCRTGNLPFRPVMKKYRFAPVLGKFRQPFGKLLVGFCGDKTFRFKGQTKDFSQAMDEYVAVLLVHSETGRMIFLQRVVFQINQNEEQAVGYAGKGAVLVDGRTAAFSATAFPGHFILGQIVLMRSLEIREKCTKLFMANSRQGTETFAVVFMVVVIHVAKVHAYARYITNLNYINSIVERVMERNMKKRSNFTPMERFREILHGNGLQSMNVGTNHIRIFKDGRKLFDYYPLRMKLFDYHDWHQLTYPFAENGDRTWETELGNIIRKLTASPQ